MPKDLILTDAEIDEAAFRAAMADTLAAARLEGAGRVLVALWRGGRLGILTPDGKAALEDLAAALGARGDEGEERR